MGVLGTAIAIDELRGILAIVLIFIAYFRKIWIEEKWLVNQFGSEYIQYQLKVKALIPFIL
jgi:protein-S-isoprenylcysteine O-methyltransferase Ste14